MTQHSLSEGHRGTTKIAWDGTRRQWQVWSTDPQMIVLLKAICAQYGVVPDEEGGALRFVGPAEMRLGADDFSPETRSRISFGMSMPATQDAGVIDGRQPSGVVGEVVMTMNKQGVLDTQKGEAE